MKVSLSTKLVICYIAIGIVSFFLVTLGGSLHIEKYLERTQSEALYQEAVNIASSEMVTHQITSSNLQSIRESLAATAAYQGTKIWILNSQNEVLVDTAGQSDQTFTIDEFDPTAWGSSYYQVGDFYDQFDSSQLSVIAPITEELTTKGYVAIHYPMQSLYHRRSSLLRITQLYAFLVYLITLVIIILYHLYVHRPLNQIVQGTAEFAGGNLSYKIPVTSEDEMGYLANMLNYMAEKLNKNGNYQRRFISDISHDFRSPLTSVKGYVEAMLDGTIPPELMSKYLGIIAYETNRLEKLTRSLLTLNDLDVQKRMMHLQKFDINETVRHVAATFEGSCTERKIHLELYLSGKELPVKADLEQIQQVLYNLLDNAIKFSRDNSSIILETTDKNGKVFVSVKDHGCGIPKENLSKIWERFYKIDTSRGKDRSGTGLGLCIVREIINAHGQNIDVISTVDTGTEFIFTLEKA